VRLSVHTLFAIEMPHKKTKFIIDDPGSAAFRSFQMAGVESSLLSSARPRRRGECGPAAVPRFCLLSPKLLPFVQPMTLPYFPILSATSTSMTLPAYDKETY
jgi:hypothetical protein